MKKAYDTGRLKKLSIGFIGICLAFTGCQPTPKENAVVRKAEGLNEAVIAEPMKDGETRMTDIPKHWQMEELKNNDRMMVSADLSLIHISEPTRP